MKQIIACLITDTHLKEENIEINKSIYKQCINFCKQNNLDTIFHLSDIFNSRKSQTQEVLVDGFLEILDDLQENDIKIVTFPGNHDKTSYERVESFLHPFKHHPSFTLIDEYYHCLLTESVCVHFIPFFSDEEYNRRLKEVEKKYKKVDGVEDILFTHIGVTGAKMNNGTSVESISQNSFHFFNKVFIGHYHDKQVFGDGRFNYIGSTIQHNYGETPDKGLTVLYDDLSWETVELVFPRYFNIEVDVEKITQKDIEELKEYKKESSDFLRVTLCGSEEKVKSFNKFQLLDSGLSVEQKIDRINKTEIEDRVEPFTSITLIDEFKRFCEKNNIVGSRYDKGYKYLERII